MNTYSLTPLLRHAVGFDHFDRLMDNLNKIDETTVSYPPYNIEKCGENDYLITIAVAGFAQSDLTLVQERDILTVRGRIEKQPETQGKSFLHKGIATRAFERKFNLADHVRVVSAALENGLLQIVLHREIPEAEKPRMIEINGNIDGNTLKKIASKAK